MGWKDPLEKGMATHFSNLAWRISWTEKPGGLQSMGLQRVGLNRVTNHFTFKNVQLGLPWWSSGEDSALPMGVGVGVSSIPGQGTKIPDASQPGKKKKKKRTMQWA